jgi:hypothetical protein
VEALLTTNGPVVSHGARDEHQADREWGDRDGSAASHREGERSVDAEPAAPAQECDESLNVLNGERVFGGRGSDVPFAVTLVADASSDVASAALRGGLTPTSALAKIAWFIRHKLQFAVAPHFVCENATRIDLSLEFIGEGDRGLRNKPVAVFRLPVPAGAGDLWRDLADIIRERAPPPNSVVEIFPFLRGRVSAEYIHTHCCSPWSNKGTGNGSLRP